MCRPGRVGSTDSLGGENLEKSLTVLKPGGQAISVTGPPDLGFANQLGAPKFMSVVMGLLSRKVHKVTGFEAQMRNATNVATPPPTITAVGRARTSPPTSTSRPKPPSHAP